MGTKTVICVNKKIIFYQQNYTCPMCTGGFIEELENGGNNNSSSMELGSEDADIDVDIRGINVI